MRIFRADRMVAVSVLDQRAEILSAFDLDEALVDGRGVINREEETLVVRYSPTVARWIAEREEQAISADGSITVEYPLLDDAWAVRTLLQYGEASRGLGPPKVIKRLRDTLSQTLEDLS